MGQVPVLLVVPSHLAPHMSPTHTEIFRDSPPSPGGAWGRSRTRWCTSTSITSVCGSLVTSPVGGCHPPKLSGIPSEVFRSYLPTRRRGIPLGKLVTHSNHPGYKNPDFMPGFQSPKLFPVLIHRMHILQGPTESYPCVRILPQKIILRNYFIHIITYFFPMFDSSSQSSIPVLRRHLYLGKMKKPLAKLCTWGEIFCLLGGGVGAKLASSLLLAELAAANFSLMSRPFFGSSPLTHFRPACPSGCALPSPHHPSPSSAQGFASGPATPSHTNIATNKFLPPERLSSFLSPKCN